ncbi:MAG: holo-ACP synthase [Phycisphaerales bacterium]
MRVIGLGTDLVAVERIARMVREHGERFLERTYTVAERDECVGKQREAQRLAARFAAKEAAMKALGTGLSRGINWRDFGIVTLPSGEPRLMVVGMASHIAAERGVDQWMVSMSDTDEYATATVIACGPEPATVRAVHEKSDARSERVFPPRAMST